MIWFVFPFSIEILFWYLLCMKFNSVFCYLVRRRFFSFTWTLGRLFFMMLILVSGPFFVPAWAGKFCVVFLKERMRWWKLKLIIQISIYIDYWIWFYLNLISTAIYKTKIKWWSFNQLSHWRHCNFLCVVD
jgi:hypothetical protein